MKKLFISLLAVAALAACSKNEAPVGTPAGDDVVRFSSNLQTYTVKSTVLDGKTVKIVAGAPISATTTATAAGNTLTPATELHWVKDQTQTTTFTSVYPADIELNASGRIEDYNLLYNGAQDFEYHSAVLTAAAKNVTPKTTVNFEYKHPFSMLLVTVVNQLEGAPAISKLNVSNVALQGTLDLAAGSVAPATTLADADATLKDGKYAVVIMPQSAMPELNVTVGEKNYKFILNAAIDFQANKRYNATVTIKDSTPVVEEGEAATFGFTVADWEDATDEINYVDITEQWSVIGKLQDTNWDKDFVMVEGETAGLLELEITYKTGDEFKLRKAADWAGSAGLKDGVTYVGDDAWDGFLTTSDNNIKLAAAGVYKLTFNPVTWAFTATKTGDVAPDPTPDAGKIIFNVYNGAGWESMTFYGWVEADPWPTFAGAWPGTAPAATDVVVNGVSYKSFVVENVPLNADNLYYLLYGGDDAKKTVNLKLPVTLTAAETTVFVQLKADKSVEVIADPATWTAPDPSETPAEVWGVIGLATDWTNDKAMTQDATDPNLWTIVVTLGSGNEGNGFKFRLNGAWDHQFGSATTENMTINVDALGADEYVQLAADNPSGGNIVLTPDARSYTLKLYVDGDNKGRLYIVK